uniref:C-C motif chemokine n=1 Tax=Nannospalax galili TaxID=1026970 RepID=A0A8C6QMW2_NANGA
MKISAALLCLLLTAASISPQELAGPDSVSTPVTCCYMVTRKMIPIQRLKSYRIASFCPQVAVILKTKQNGEVCANPTEKWVKHSVMLLDQKSHALQP